MRAIVAAILATTIFTSSVMAESDSAAPVAPLSPGKPAGVKQADIEMGGVVMWLGIAAVAGGIALLAVGTQGKNSATTTQ